MKIRDKIKKLLQQHGELSVKEMIDLLHVSKQAIHKSITQLLEANEVLKLGKVPKTIYRLNNLKPAFEVTTSATAAETEFLQKNFY
jgi:DeoR/GlpR family transcriptional regulator of sugar metabolism